MVSTFCFFSGWASASLSIMHLYECACTRYLHFSIFDSIQFIYIYFEWDTNVHGFHRPMRVHIYMGNSLVAIMPGLGTRKRNKKTPKVQDKYHSYSRNHDRIQETVVASANQIKEVDCYDGPVTMWFYQRDHQLGNQSQMWEEIRILVP